MGKSHKETLRLARKWAAKQYEKQRRHNLVHARPGIHEFVIILDNLKPTYNIGKIFRSADAFGAREVHLIGIDYFECTSAKGSFKWVPARFHTTFDACYQSLTEEGYTLFTMEPERDNLLSKTSFPVKSGFVFGHEEFGLSFDPDAYEGVTGLSIPQYGRVESLNVSVAASVVMYEYQRQHAEIVV
ncbi:TrmH family RNA methyltransferase [Desulforhopalus sp. 52FAK]